MAEFPAIPLFTDAYLADTRHLTTTQHGAYLLLLFEMWRRPNCNLPNDDKLLARLAGLPEDEWESIKSDLFEFFVIDKRSKTISQKRLLKERTFVARKTAVRREAAAKRWKQRKKDNANAMQTGMQNVCKRDAPTPTPTPTPTKKKKKLKEKETPRSILTTVVTPETANNILEHRQRLRKPLTVRAAQLMAKQLSQCADPNEASDMMIEHGWQAIKANWYKNQKDCEENVKDINRTGYKSTRENRQGNSMASIAFRRWSKLDL